MRILALDIGEKRIGFAISEEKIQGAYPLQTLVRSDLEQDFEKILEIIQEYSVQELVVGLPYRMNGTEGSQANKTKKFVSGLEKFLDRQNLKIPIEWSDERLTSWEGREKLIGKKAKKNKEAIDAMAACLILENYLAKKNR